MMNDIFDSGFAQIVGWSLIHFLWQGLANAMLAWIALAVCPTKKSMVRYAIGCGALLLMLICPIITIGWISTGFDIPFAPVVNSGSVPISTQIGEMNVSQIDSSDILPDKVSVAANSSQSNIVSELEEREQPTIANGGAGRDENRHSFAVFSSLRRTIAPAIPWLTLIWSAGVCLLSLKLIFNWYRVQRVKASGKPLESGEVAELFERLKNILKVNVSVPLRESIEVYSPSVIGWVQPVVLLPLSCTTGLSKQELTAVLAHELAHIRRADYLVNLLQAVIETLLFYHPAVWWLSRQVRQERENCCDDLAVEVCGDKRTYVEALLKLEQSRPAESSLALASDGGDLIQRVSRILGQDSRSAGKCNWLAGVLGMAIAGWLLVGAGIERQVEATTTVQEPVQDEAKANEKSEEKTNKKVRVSVVGPDKQPIKGASLMLGVWYQETANTLTFKTDEKGIAELPLPDGLRIFRLWADAEGYTGLVAVWEKAEIKAGKLPPSEFTFPMVPAVEIGGMFVNEGGEPIPGVAIEVSGGGGKLDDRISFNSSLASGRDVAVSDEQGRWRLANVPPGDDVKISLRITHPDYLSDNQSGEIQSQYSFGLKEFRDQSARIVLREGNKVRGKITDENGEPVRDALVVWGDNPYMQEGSQEVPVNADGSYETPILQRPICPAGFLVTVVRIL